MKNKTTNSSISKTLLKMLAGACVGAAIGAVFGALYFIRSENLDFSTSGQWFLAIQNVLFPALVIVMVLSVVLQELYYAKLKKICSRLMDAEDEEFDILDYEEESKGAIFQTINLFSQVISVILLSFGYSFDYLTHNKIALGSCIVFIICFFYDGFVQTRYIKLLQQVHPEKHGDVSSMKFHEQWLASCDEAEKEVIYQSAYRSFSFTGKFIALLLPITLVVNLFFHIGIATTIVVGIIYLIHSLTYYKSCVRMKKVRVSR